MIFKLIYDRPLELGPKRSLTDTIPYGLGCSHEFYTLTCSDALQGRTAMRQADFNFTLETRSKDKLRDKE